MAALTQLEHTYFTVLAAPKFERKQYIRRVYTGGIYKVGFNWAPMARKLGTTISSSAWAIVSGSSGDITLSSSTSTTITAGVTVTVSGNGGYEEIMNTVTFADGEKDIRKIKLCLSDPDTSNYDEEYTFDQ